jgi:GNAT superfamily N-acetyltransferase
MIRPAEASELASVVEVWRVAGLRFYPATAERELATAISQHLVLIDEQPDGEVTGTVFGGYDGMRGWIHRLATRPDWRGRGIAAALVTDLERRLAALGCPKVNLLISPGNTGVAGFYGTLGYRRDAVTFMEKWLVPQPPVSSFPPNGPESCPQVNSPAASWSDIQPDLRAEPYVFAAGEPPPGVSPFALIREDEGVTLILTRADADQVGLAYDYVAARITLRVNSALDGVGLTALFSRTLADAGISCNVIAARSHDHIFVDWTQRTQALTLLSAL